MNRVVIVRNGALDDTALMSPGATVWTSRAPERAWIDESLPQHGGQPPAVACRRAAGLILRPMGITCGFFR